MDSVKDARNQMEADLANLDLAEALRRRMDYSWQAYCKELLAATEGISSKAKRILCKTMSTAERIDHREPLQVETIS